MKRAQRRPASAEVEEVRRRIEHWRQTRTKRTAMPKELWAAAVELTKEHGVYRIAQNLRVDYSTLKLRAVQAGSDAAPLAGFVELDPGQVFGGREPHSGGVVELSATDGARMTIRWGVGQQMNAVGLAEAFWRRGP